MNEQIKELAAKAREFATTKDAFGEYVIAFDNEKFEQRFAEMIVRECAEVASRTGRLNASEFVGGMIADAIKEHFRVKE